MSLTQTVGRAFYGGFQELRPSQRDAITPILNGENVLVLSPTGSGKTEAVLAPLIDKYLSLMRSTRGCTLLYLTPTRALANDLLRRLEPALSQLGLSAGIRHGERNDLSRASKPEVLITTPESLDVMLVSGEPSILSVQVVVVDEIHLTYNTQRGFQLAVLLRRLESATARRLQIVGLSATVSDPKSIWQFFRPNEEPVVVQDQRRKALDYCIADAPTHDAIGNLIDTLAAQTQAKILLFANSRRECDRLAVALRGKTSLGENVFVHHSSLDRQVRLEVESRFQQSSRAICVATSTLELGIDIGDIDVVMLYGCPASWESLLQRIGRGNRRSEKTNVVCLVSPEHGSLFSGVLGFEALFAQIQNNRFERERPLEIYGSSAQQIMSILAEREGAYHRIADLVALFAPWPHMTRTVIEDILHTLTASGHVIPHRFQNKFGAGPELHRLRDLSLIWSNFSSRSRDLKLVSRGRDLGVIPSNNLLRLRPGVVVRFAGRHWKVRTVQSRVVDLLPSNQPAALEISYSGSKAPVDPAVIEEMLRLVDAGMTTSKVISQNRDEIERVANRIHQHVCWDRIPVCVDQNGYHYFTFAGQVMNSVLARWAGLKSYDAGEIVLRSDQQIQFSTLPTDPSALSAAARETMKVPDNLSIFQQLLPTELLELEFVDSWLKTPVFARSLGRLQGATVTPVALDDLRELYA